MKAARFHGVHDVRVDTLDRPTVGETDVLIAPIAVGVCGTDTHIVDGKFMSAPPMALGHEIAGRIVEIGSSVTNLAVGDLVTVEPHLYCGVCFQCQTGMLHMCPNRKAPGVHLEGGMAEFLVVPATIAYLVPPDTDPAHAALTEPIACCVHAIDRLEIESGMPIAIYGAGPAGAIMVALAKLAGASPVVSIEMREQRRDLASRFGADITLDPTAPDFTEKITAITNGVGFPYIVDAVGSSRVLASAIPLASRGGRILLFGVADPADTLVVSPNEIYAKELTILGTALNPYTHRRAIGLLPKLPLHEFNAGYFGLDDIHLALQAQQDGTFDKVFITPQEATTAA